MNARLPITPFMTAPPGASARPVALALGRRATRDDEVDDVRALLLEHAEPTAGTPEAIAAMAETVAVACLGDDHLWQDLQLPARAELTALMRHWFARLAAKNDRDMKWKKFLYKQLCEREEIFVCKSPSCAVCSDHAACFGPE
ncbi:nitrogen fixation protein NifQ [Ideonella sp. DXS22W]|uniref:Nitrogen fixation protein NifQ n=1 Tax=Pseudaquabacterium inlustre TaxID=2984192 RepID=A0ABU9CQ54_9BURK